MDRRKILSPYVTQKELLSEICFKRSSKIIKKKKNNSTKQQAMNTTGKSTKEKT